MAERALWEAWSRSWRRRWRRRRLDTLRNCGTIPQIMASRLQVLLAALCFGTTGTAQALGPALEPSAVGAGRIAVGAALLALIAGVSRGGLPRPSNGAEAGIVLLCGAFVAVYQLTFFAAVADTGVAVGTVV